MYCHCRPPIVTFVHYEFRTLICATKLEKVLHFCTKYSADWNVHQWSPRMTYVAPFVLGLYTVNTCHSLTGYAKKQRKLQTSSYTYFEDKRQWLLHKHSVCNHVNVYNNSTRFNQNGLPQKHKFNVHIFKNLKKGQNHWQQIKWDKLNSIWSLKDLPLKRKTLLLRFSCPTWGLAEHITTEPHLKKENASHKR